MERTTIRKVLGDVLVKVNPAKIVAAEARLQRLVKAGYLTAEAAIPALADIRSKVSPITSEEIEETGAKIRAYFSDESEENGEKQVRVSFKSRVRDAFATADSPEAFHALVGTFLSEANHDLERASLTETLSEALACGASNQDLFNALSEYETSQEKKRQDAAAKVKAAK